jgi:hypothetical protein
MIQFAGGKKVDSEEISFYTCPGYQVHPVISRTVYEERGENIQQTTAKQNMMKHFPDEN